MSLGNALKYISLAAVSLMACGCNDVLGGIYDEAPGDESGSEFKAHPSGQPNRYVLTIDATDYLQWHFVDFHALSVETRDIPLELTGEWDGRSGLTYNDVSGGGCVPLRIVATDTPQQPRHWDLAIHHFDVATNGGQAAATDVYSIDNLKDAVVYSDLDMKADVWSTGQAIVDFKGMMSFDIGYQNCYVNPELCAWVAMDFSTPPPVYSATGLVYIVQFSDDSRAALHLDSYMSAAGTKGMLTIDVLYPFE